MQETPYLLWLEEIGEAQRPLVGDKAANLAAMLRAGFPVPPSFCLTAALYGAVMCDQGPEALQGQQMAEIIREYLVSAPLSSDIQTELRAAYELLRRQSPFGPRVALRFSATVENLTTTSFAGQGRTLLNVASFETLLDAIRLCWASLWEPGAQSYGCTWEGETPAMAVLVQIQVPVEASGVAFSLDPASGEAHVVIEAHAGPGEAVVGGRVQPTRYTVDRRTARSTGAEQGPLTTAQAQELARLVLALEEHFGGPQDVEWSLHRGRFYLLQSRPITARPTGFFTSVLPDDDHLWTAGFLNERFPLPVSPLGWTVVRELLEELAFRDPLHYLGVRDAESWPITKLCWGHPYVNVRVFQTLYHPFPDLLLPEDAARYFPAGDTTLRRDAVYPCSWWDPRMLLSLARAFLRQPRLCSPWHCHHQWARFLPRHQAEMSALRQAAQDLKPDAELQAIWQLIERAQALNRQLLTLHRWSLTHAELWYSLLRRLIGVWIDPAQRTSLSSALVAEVPNKSVELDRVLRRLAAIREGSDFEAALGEFLAHYGHRSFSLDLYEPPFNVEPAQVLQLVGQLRGASVQQPPSHPQEALSRARKALRRGMGGWLRWPLFQQVVHLARRYMGLREDQRFYWQQTLAQMRCLFLRLGRHLQAEGVLQAPEELFFATWEELRAHVAGEGHLDRGLLLRRRAEFHHLRKKHRRAPTLHYLPFLRGNHPLEEGPLTLGTAVFQGQPVSPGLAQGPARVVTSPEQLSQVQAGEVLVAHSLDPGWTPVFGLVVGLVFERGGQLSHAAVVAREYGLPAVTAVPGIVQRIRTGQRLVVDGTSGLVHILEGRAPKT